MNHDDLGLLLCFPAFLFGCMAALAVVAVQAMLGFEGNTHPILSTPFGVLVFTVFVTPAAMPAFGLSMMIFGFLEIVDWKRFTISGVITGLALYLVAFVLGSAPFGHLALVPWMVGGATGGAVLLLLEERFLRERK